MTSSKRTQKDLFARFQQDPACVKDSQSVFRKIIGLDPIDEPPPEAMPAIEKIKIFARAGFIARFAGTPERFEGIWAEAFPDEKSGKQR
jgi:hypothetical protein